MAKITNTFIQGKMNKDLEGRLIPKNDFREALNAQVSKSEGSNVGTFQNVLGNELVLDIGNIEGLTDLQCVGFAVDEITSRVFLFLTNNVFINYVPTASNFIYVYNSLTQQAKKLVEGNFLNFSTRNKITGINVLENLLFFTDNRNQPRKINIETALFDNTYYTTEDQISVAKYNPYKNIELYAESPDLADKYETTMYDVSSKFYPTGGVADIDGVVNPASSTVTLQIPTIQGNIPTGATIGFIDANGLLVDTGATVSNYITSTGILTTSSAIGPFLTGNVQLVFDFNYYYEGNFNGDKEFLEDKFVRFGYRFEFDDGEYSIMSPFTQNTFIPKQDGYFLYAVQTAPPLDVKNEEEAYTSTVVELMENKVDKIVLRIPFEYNNNELESKLKIKNIDILYKESDQISISVLETIPISQVAEQGCQALVNGATSSSTTLLVDNISFGTIKVGDIVNGAGVTNSPQVVSFSEASGTVTLSSAQSLADNEVLIFGTLNVFEYEYQSKKPYKILPQAETTRVYDKVPVKALAQEIIGNRVVYGNFQNKHTPPASIDYNVAVSEKEAFELNLSTGIVQGGPYPPGTTIITVNITKGDTPEAGDIISGAGIATGCEVQEISGSNITITIPTTDTISTGLVVFFEPGSDTLNTTSIIEYPNSSLKQSRNYQVGVVLSDRYGRQSTVVLSNNTSSITFSGNSFKGSTVFSEYLEEVDNTVSWPGESLKLLFNQPFQPVASQVVTGWPGIYNGDASSNSYNPLGWYSFKIVVKQQEQEYYNVYLPGVLASYPLDPTKEINKTSHTVLINDNVNKVPRDLSEVGPLQKQFRSSVKLYGRVENNTGTDAASWNNQYYPNNTFDVATIVSTNNDLFNGDLEPSFTPCAQFYDVESDPLIARISTENKFGIVAAPVQRVANVTALTGQDAGNDEITFDMAATPTVGQPVVGDFVSGEGLPDGLQVYEVTNNPATSVKVARRGAIEKVTLSAGTVLSFIPSNQDTNVQKLAVYETEPVESNLEIFWETSTSGLITDINDAILDENVASNSIINFNSINFCESNAIGSNVSSTDFNLVDNFNANITYAATDPPQLQLIGVTDFADVDRSSDFNFIDNANGTYNIQTAATFVHDFDVATSGTFSFEFLATVNGIQSTIVIEPVQVCNIEPVIGNCPPSAISWDPNLSLDLNVFTGVNGSASTTLAGSDLVWSLTVEKDGVQFGPAPEGNETFFISNITEGSNQQTCTVSIVPEAEDVQNNPGNYNFTLTLTDAGGDSVDCNFVVTIVSTSCCYYFGFLPRQGATIGAGQGQTEFIPEVRAFRYTNCNGELVNTTVEMRGRFEGVCAQDNYPEIEVTVNGVTFFDSTENLGFARYCVPGQQIFENGEPVVIGDEEQFVPNCGS